MQSLAGVLQLVRLVLRLDRIKLPLWMLLTVGLIALTIPQLTNAYATQAQRLEYAGATAPSVVTRLLGGAITGPTMGEIVIVETFTLAAVMLVLLNIFLVTRHTRKNEETGRGELIGSMLVGRSAQLTAVLVVAFKVNLICSAAIYGLLAVNDLPVGGSLLYSLGLGLLGMTFAAVGSVCVQLFESSRSANGMACLIFGLAFLIRGVGDALGALQSGGLSVVTAPLSYLSPLGWVTNSLPYASGQRWWPLGLFAVAIPMVLLVAYGLLGRRDFGAGLVRPKPGRAYATAGLLRRFGLVWRINRSVFIVWLVSFAIVGAVLGAVAQEFESLISGNAEMQELLASIGGSKEASDIMFGAMFTIAGIALAGYAVQILTRMNAEATSGRLELMLATSMSRLSWMTTYIVFSVVTASLILAATGFAAGVVYGLINGDLIGSVQNLGFSILVHIPAIVVVVGLGAVLFGMLPRLFVPLAWGALGACLLVFQLGSLLDLPQWVLNISPFTHTPPAPAAALTFTPLVYESIVALVLIGLGLRLFVRRDVVAA